MQRRPSIDQKASRQRGMSLLELMIAMTVLVVGLLSLMSLILVAVSSNTRNKTDTGGTLVAEVFMESILSQPGGGTVQITDCANNSLTVSTAGPAAVGTSNGATLLADGSGIDFTQLASAVTPAGYKATYVTCGAGGSTTTYDVRWNVRAIDNLSRMVTVAAQHKAGTSGRLFTPPVSLRSILTNN
jgi:prepilin-type N-terminal cleavage/methylation domain-containing protein